MYVFLIHEVKICLFQVYDTLLSPVFEIIVSREIFMFDSPT